MKPSAASERRSWKFPQILKPAFRPDDEEVLSVDEPLSATKRGNR
jgi:hypothetical protein